MLVSYPPPETEFFILPGTSFSRTARLEPYTVAGRKRQGQGQIFRFHDWQHNRAGMIFAVVGDPNCEAAWKCVEGPGPGVAAGAGAGNDETDAGILPEYVGKGKQLDPELRPFAAARAF